MDAGAEVHQPLREQFWGDRHGQIIDPFGHRWGLSQHVRDVPHEEIARAAAEAFGGQGYSSQGNLSKCGHCLELPLARLARKTRRHQRL